MRIVVGLGFYRSIFKSKRYFKFISILFLFYATRSRIPTAELGNIIATKLVSPRYLQSEQPAIDINKWNEFYGNLSQWCNGFVALNRHVIFIYHYYYYRYCCIYRLPVAVALAVAVRFRASLLLYPFEWVNKSPTTN